ncbi:MAG: beta-1,6-N-acetylglucosaminyltransferase [Marinibacterium sp.]|nr:beta-1,6-N-acetylglucosaminyltransferase [Marinibacterium sp.]
MAGADVAGGLGVTLGVVILAHEALHRVAQVARHWARAGVAVVVHVDARADPAQVARLQAALGRQSRVLFAPSSRSDWGSWGLVAATQAATSLMLGRFAEVRHVALTSGACLPVRPVAELQNFLRAHPDTDFIESVDIAQTPWVRDGLEQERFTLHFPFCWRRQRGRFDAAVALQRRLGIRRGIPQGLTPHLGSQWWCLTRATLHAILTDPERPGFDAYFRGVWLPDESYFQTLARRHARRIRSQSLCHAPFDPDGQPQVFYDDHADDLAASGGFWARKVWPGADGLYARFLGPGCDSPARRPLRRPAVRQGARRSPYLVLQGVEALFPDLRRWLAASGHCAAHGRLFHPDRAIFAGDARGAAGALSDHAAIRDAAPEAFLDALIRNTRGETQCFLFEPGDQIAIADHIRRDPAARVVAVTGASAIAPSLSGVQVDRPAAARGLAGERALLAHWMAPDRAARVQIWRLGEVLRRPGPVLRAISDHLGAMPPPPDAVAAAPVIRGLRALRDSGLDLDLAGDWDGPVEHADVGAGDVAAL